MKYFIITEDCTITQRPFLLGWQEKINVRDIHPESAYRLPKRELIFIRSDPEPLFTDIISTPFFMVSEKVLKTIKMYEPRLATKELVLLDQGNNKAERYFLPVFEEIACLGEGSLYNLNHSEIRKAVLDRHRIGESSMFRLAGVEKQYIVGNLDVVESILKRGCVGISLKELGCMPDA